MSATVPGPSARRIGKRAIEVPDQPGFVVNRLLFPYLFDAVRMLERTGLGPADVDACMTMGTGHPMGPMKLLDFVGLDVAAAIGESLYADSGDAAHQTPGPADPDDRRGSAGAQERRGLLLLLGPARLPWSPAGSVGRTSTPSYPRRVDLAAASDRDAADLAALVARCNAMYRGWAPADWNPSDSLFDDERPRIAERIADPLAWIRLTREHGMVAGFVDWRPDRQEYADAELRSLYVEPTLWARGIGRGLLRAAQRAIRGAGLETAHLWVPDGDQRAIRLYESERWHAAGSSQWHARLRLPMHRYELNVLDSSAAAE